ncbi:MAG: hypothetical protein DRI84_10160 [Bacteroidetes bacterium]|nr:MAG: hypothetical protein DRI84_10160 [Bacteroidota bacterium]
MGRRRYIMTKEHREALRQAKLGVPKDEATKKAISEGMLRYQAKVREALAKTAERCGCTKITEEEI